MNAFAKSRAYGPTCSLAGAGAASLIWIAILAYQARVDSAGLPTGAEPDYVPVARQPILAPNEHDKKVLSSYVIEPPDILFIEAIRVMPKAPYRIRGGDELQIIADPPETGLAARGFFVDAQGRIHLGPRFGKGAKVVVAGLSTDDNRGRPRCRRPDLSEFRGFADHNPDRPMRPITATPGRAGRHGESGNLDGCS
jgi:hypothetical protein